MKMVYRNPEVKNVPYQDIVLQDLSIADAQSFLVLDLNNLPNVSSSIMAKDQPA